MSPPWRSATAPARIIRTHSQTIVARVTKSGGRELAVANGQRTCKGTSAIARQTVAGALADAVAMALPQPLLWRSALNGNRIVFRIAGSRTTGGLRQPLLFVRRSPAGGIATFPMYKRTRSTRSGECQPAVCRADLLAQALPQLLGTLSTGVLADAVAMAFV